MSIKWGEKSKPAPILVKIDQSKTINDNGDISFNGFSLENNKSALHHMLVFNSEIPDYEKKKMIWEGLVNTGKKSTIEPNSLISELSILQRNYLRRKKKNYVLVSSLSLARNVKIPRKVFDKSTFTFTRNLPEKFRLEKEKIYQYAKHSIHGELPKGYLNVKLSIVGRSEYDAIDKSLHKLDLLRGIWNLYFNLSQSMRHSSSPRKPVNRIVLGPIQTLHHPNGKAATSAFWYEDNYLEPAKLFNCNNRIDNMFKFELSVRKLLKNHKYYDTITTFIVRYGRSLDDSNMTSCFLNLWGILEGLTASVNDNHIVTIKRTSFMWNEPEYHSQILQNLRMYRNSNVHSGSISDDIETYVYQLKIYVEHLLEFHISNRFGFKNIHESHAFMDLPTNTIELHKRKKLLLAAIKYRKS